MDSVDPRTGRLRRPTLVSAPLLVLALMSAGLNVWLIAWGFWYSDSLGVSFWAPLTVTFTLVVLCLSGARGCFVDVGDTTVKDVVCWIPTRTIDRQSIARVGVRPGMWRVFQVTLEDGTHRVLLGASPTQFPARLLPSAEAQDMADIELILGE